MSTEDLGVRLGWSRAPFSYQLFRGECWPGQSAGVFLGEDRAWECCKIVMDGVVHEDTFSGSYLLIASGKRLSHQARRVSAVIGLALILAAITAFLSLRLAKQFGRLSVPPLYDDVSYFVEAASWLDPASRRLCRTICHQCGHSAGVPAWDRSSDMAAAVRGYCDVPGRCGVRTGVLAHQDGSASRPAVGSGTRIGRRHLLYRPFLQRSRWSVFGLGALCGLAAAIKPSAFPASLTCIGLAAGAQLVCECLEADAGGFRAAVRRAALPALIFAAGLLAGTFAIIGFELLNILNYIWIAMVDYRDFWVADESFRDSLLHYSVGLDGRTALNYWLWFGLALIPVRFGLALLHDRRDVGRSITLLVAVLVAYAIPTLSPVKSYFVGAMFYGVFIVAMALNLCAIIGGFEGILWRPTLSPALRRWLVSGLHLLPLVVALSLFAHNCLPGRVELATRFNQDQIHDMRTATEKVWSLLQQKSLMPDAQASVEAGKVAVVTFSSPYPVTSRTIQLYAVQARVPLRVRGQYFNRTLDAAAKVLLASDVAIVTSSIPHNLPGPRMGDELIGRMDADPGMCLVDSLPLLVTRVVRIYRRGDPGCGTSAAPSR